MNSLFCWTGWFESFRLQIRFKDNILWGILFFLIAKMERFHWKPFPLSVYLLNSLFFVILLVDKIWKNGFGGLLIKFLRDGSRKQVLKIFVYEFLLILLFNSINLISGRYKIWMLRFLRSSLWFFYIIIVIG